MLETVHPTVSVIMSTRNREKMIGTAIQSVLNQSYPDFEFIIVDGASTDSTPQVVASFSDPRIVYIRQEENYSNPQCLILATSLAKGKYIAIQDDDDEWYPEKLEKQIELFERSDPLVGVIYCWEELWDFQNSKLLQINRPSLRGNIYNDLLERSGGTGGGSLMVMRREVFDDYPFLDLTRLPSDYLWNIRISKKYSFDYVPQVLSRTNLNHYYNRLSGVQANSLSYNDVIDLYELILQEFDADYTLQPSKRRYHYKTIANAALKSKRWGVASKYLRLGFMYLWKEPSFYKSLFRLMLRLS